MANENNCQITITVYFKWWAKFYLFIVRKLAKQLLFIFGENLCLNFSKWILIKGVCAKHIKSNKK